MAKRRRLGACVGAAPPGTTTIPTESDLLLLHRNGANATTGSHLACETSLRDAPNNNPTPLTPYPPATTMHATTQLINNRRSTHGGLVATPPPPTYIAPTFAVAEARPTPNFAANAHDQSTQAAIPPPPSQMAPTFAEAEIAPSQTPLPTARCRKITLMTISCDHDECHQRAYRIRATTGARPGTRRRTSRRTLRNNSQDADLLINFSLTTTSSDCKRHTARWGLQRPRRCHLIVARSGGMALSRRLEWGS